MSSMSIFGGKSLATGNEFEGTFTAFAYDRQGDDTTVESSTAYMSIIRRFLNSNWNTMHLHHIVVAAQKLCIPTQIFIPTIYSEFGPYLLVLKTVRILIAYVVYSL